MNAEVQKAVAEFLNLLINGLKQGVELGKQEIPLIAQEFITFSLIYQWFIILFACGLFVFGLVVFIKNAKHLSEHNHKFIYVLMSIPCFVIGASVFIANISKTLLVTFAPKIFLIKELASLFK